MRKAGRLLALALGGLLVSSVILAGCSSSPKQYTSPGTPIEVGVGQEFEIVLESNPSTGFEWQAPGALDKSLKLVDSGFISPKKQVPGAPGQQFWRYQGVSAGTSEISYEYLRSFEKGVPPATTSTFKVTVK